jgi:hypothetical protein
MKHVDVKHLWVEETTRGGLLIVRRVAGENDPADILTKPHNISRLSEVLRSYNVCLWGEGGFRKFVA